MIHTRPGINFQPARSRRPAPPLRRKESSAPAIRTSHPRSTVLHNMESTHTRGHVSTDLLGVLVEAGLNTDVGFND